MWQLLKILAIGWAVAFLIQPADAKEQSTGTKSHEATGPKSNCPMDFSVAGDGKGAAKCPPISSINAKPATTAAQRDAVNNAGNPICPNACPNLIKKSWITTYSDCVDKGTMIVVSGVYEFICDD